MRNRRTKLLALVSIAAAALLYPLLICTAKGTSASSAVWQRSQPKRTAGTKVPSATGGDYSRFTHNNPPHQQKCDSCHKFPSSNWKQIRKGDEAFEDVTDYPEHSSCLGCHRQQFFRGATPSICRVCHVDPSPRNSARYPFPNPREIFDASTKGQSEFSEYKVYFPHEKHEGMFGQARPAIEPDRGARLVRASSQQENEAKGQETQPTKNSSCLKCHRDYKPQGESDEEFVTKPPKDLPENAFWLKKGTFKTAPQDHALCFTCHSQEGGLMPAASDCAACHKLLSPGQIVARRETHGDFDPKMAAAMGITDKTMLEKWRRREAGKFRHEWVIHADLSCTDCHNTAKINTLDGKGPEVPVLSCGGAGSGCHVTATSDEGGALNAEFDQKKSEPGFQCTKCHVLLGTRSAPESHISALAAIKDKK
ncbi:MAG: cytochrome c3 family protein [Blastocatellia bacterium]